MKAYELADGRQIHTYAGDVFPPELVDEAYWLITDLEPAEIELPDFTTLED